MDKMCLHFNLFCIILGYMYHSGCNISNQKAFRKHPNNLSFDMMCYLYMKVYWFGHYCHQSLPSPFLNICRFQDCQIGTASKLEENKLTFVKTLNEWCMMFNASRKYINIKISRWLPDLVVTILDIPINHWKV